MPVPPSRPGLTARGGRAAPAAFAMVAATMVVMTIGANMPTPLFPRYADDYGLTPLGVTSIFATYTICLAPSLLVLGPLSDVIGRRRVLSVGLLVGALASATLAAAHGVWWLYAGRALQGVAVGAVQGTAVAALAETHPRSDLGRAAVTGTVATATGTALGPLVAGVLAQYFAAPLRLSYLCEVVLLAGALTGVLAWVPTVRPDSRGHARSRRPSVPPSIRATFCRASASAVLAWTATALFLALAPSYLRASLHTSSSALVGAVVAMMLGASAVAQLLAMRRKDLALQVTGLALLATGLITLIAAAAAGSLLLCAVAAVVTGVGQGLAFSGSAREIGGVIPPAQRGNVMSLYFLAIYLAVSVAVVALGLAATAVNLLAAVQAFAVVVSVLCVPTIWWHVHSAHRHRPTQARPTSKEMTR